ncbi:unnamed protein product [Anisakis simplex]|uniref:G_PROTEIN_RECEP_F1_2 domain-containing protein n=1 Tax=Anisakis simplex TaxID=6269 RepID=A0A158PPI5_ANISI|nr:unnamed protein product [Anisakis simplex]
MYVQLSVYIVEAINYGIDRRSHVFGWSRENHNLERAEPLVPVMFLVTSFDRLLSLVAPMSYFKNGFRLQIIQITVSHGIVAALVIEAWIETLPDIEPNKDNVCWTSDGMRASHVAEFFYIRVVTSMLSVVLYIIAYLLLRIKTAKTEHFGQAQRIFEERQRQLTLTMLISCFFTIVLYVIPVTAIFINDSISVPVLNSFINWYAILSGDTNCLVIILIIYFKQPDIAKAIKSVLRRPFTQVKSFNQSGVITVS